MVRGGEEDTLKRDGRKIQFGIKEKRKGIEKIEIQLHYTRFLQHSTQHSDFHSIHTQYSATQPSYHRSSKDNGHETEENDSEEAEFVSQRHHRAVPLVISNHIW